jgi:non-ribosomal peptide synthetase component F
VKSKPGKQLKSLSLFSLEELEVTGNLGRRLDDGSIEYAGRKDFQVKIRGYQRQ